MKFIYQNELLEICKHLERGDKAKIADSLKIKRSEISHVLSGRDRPPRVIRALVSRGKKRIKASSPIGSQELLKLCDDIIKSLPLEVKKQVYSK